MYKQYFGLRANPFSVNPDPRYLFMTPHAEEALACLTYGIQTRKGFILLTGEVGTGKTTLINRLLLWLKGQGLPTAYLFNSNLGVSELFELLLADLGIEAAKGSKSEMLLRLYDFLLERRRANQTTILIIDEAQNLSRE